MARKPTRKAVRTAGHMMLAPAVMAMRVPLLLAEAGSTDPYRVETTRATAEKLTAIAEGVMAAQASFARSAFSFWPELLSGRTPSLVDGRAIRDAMDAAAKPAGLAVSANFRRLSRARRSLR